MANQSAWHECKSDDDMDVRVNRSRGDTYDLVRNKPICRNMLCVNNNMPSSINGDRMSNGYVLGTMWTQPAVKCQRRPNVERAWLWRSDKPEKEYDYIDNFVIYSIIYSLDYCWTYVAPRLLQPKQLLPRHDVGWQNEPSYLARQNHQQNTRESV